MHHDGEMKQNPKCYDSVDYFDYMSLDEISLIEIISMLKEASLRVMLNFGINCLILAWKWAVLSWIMMGKLC